MNIYRPSFTVKLSDEHRQRLISDTYNHCYGPPSPDTWGKKYKRGGLVVQIRNEFKMGRGSNQTVRDVMESTYNQILKLKREAKEGEPLVLHDGCIDVSRKSRDYTSTMKIPPGSKYEVMACMYIEDGSPFELVADLISVEMINDGLDSGITKTAIYSMIKRLNPIRNIVKSKGQWTDNHEAWRIARYSFSLHMLVRTDELYNHESVKNI